MREECDTVADAKYLLSVYGSHANELATLESTTIASLMDLGATLLSRRYQTGLSTYAYEDKDAILAAEKRITDEWALLREVGEQKKPFLVDHLARNLFQNDVRTRIKMNTT